MLLPSAGRVSVLVEVVILKRIVSEFGVQPRWIKKEGYVEKEKRDISSSLTCL